MNTMFFLAVSQPQATDLPLGYIAGAIIALFILVYLLYTLINPDKF